MEAIRANLILNTLAECDDFEAEIDDCQTDTTNSSSEELSSDDEKVNRLIKKQRLIKKLERAELFVRYRQMRRQVDVTEQQNYKFDIETHTPETNSADDCNKTISLISTTRIKALPVGFIEYIQTWPVEVQRTPIYLPVETSFMCNTRLFHQEQKLKSYRVLYQGKYYLFEFEDKTIKDYYEV